MNATTPQRFDPATKPAAGPTMNVPGPGLPVDWPHLRDRANWAYCLCGAVWVQSMTCHPCTIGGHPPEACVDGPGVAVREHAREVYRYPDSGAGRWCSCQHGGRPPQRDAAAREGRNGVPPGYLAKALEDSARQMRAAMGGHHGPAGPAPDDVTKLWAEPFDEALSDRLAMLRRVCALIGERVRRRASSPTIEGLYAPLPPPFPHPLDELVAAACERITADWLRPGLDGSDAFSVFVDTTSVFADIPPLLVIERGPAERRAARLSACTHGGGAG